MFSIILEALSVLISLILIHGPSLPKIMVYYMFVYVCVYGHELEYECK